MVACAKSVYSSLTHACCHAIEPGVDATAIDAGHVIVIGVAWLLETDLVAPSST